MPPFERGAILTRAGTALVLLPATLLLIWLPWLSIAFTLFIIWLAIVGLWEFLALADRRSLEPESFGAAAAVVVLLLTAHFAPHRLGIMFTAMFMFLAVCHLFLFRHTISGFATATLAVVYTGWLPTHFILLRDFNAAGAGLLTLLLGVVALSDSGAYVVGKAIGRSKMAPKISPNKSWEGAVAGVLSGMVWAIACYSIQISFDWAAFPDWSLKRYLMTGAILSIAGQFGDLLESMLKRDAGVKDSGGIFPGHGGVLDRCDGYLFAGPTLYYLLSWI